VGRDDGGREHIAGGAIFEHACSLAFEDILSKHRETPISIGAVAELDQGKEPGGPGVLLFKDPAAYEGPC
jgi:hypothetical protein